ncbi:LysR family transcriptional regulator [Buttiauxella sp. B2]|uniref:LysR family transcriptional regulator n=1 Tax=Buttiauxella sp. B2 TaxID=2587812 RepID=UPI00111D0283|nr:LysR family transcriptional regulator [Buttiauxella sp. B2]TNV20565.1 LysR family transcriptional regulator [Buttiauxella sp. B2]
MNDDLTVKELKVVNSLIELKRASLAAESLGISSSAISYILKKIRLKTGDKLFNLTRKGFIPEPHAYVLQERYHNLSALGGGFDKMVVTTYSPLELLLSWYFSSLPEGVNNIITYFQTMDLSEDGRLTRLRRREVDIDIGGMLPEGASIHRSHFLHSKFCVMTRKDHSTIKNKFTKCDWENNSHLLWQRNSGTTNNYIQGYEPANMLLKQRNIVCESANLLTLVQLCSASDHIMIMPEIFIKPLASIFPLKSFDLPNGLEMEFNCYIHYHPSLQGKIQRLGMKDISKRLQNL